MVYSLTRRISLSSLKRTVLILSACMVLGFLLFWRPTYLHLRSLQKEKLYWQNVLQAESVNQAKPFNNEGTKQLSSIPTMDQLPDMIDQCRSSFGKEGVNVYAFNVERFGEIHEAGKGLNLDYGLVRLRLHGSWEGIITSLKELEEMQEFSIHVQEVVLKAEGGETLLWLDFCTDMERNIPSNP